MIAFACTHCGQKFQVKDEFAGKRAKCLTCKKPVTVPEPAPDPWKTEARVVTPISAGPPSSVAQAGFAGGRILGQAHAAQRASQKSVEKLLAGRTSKDERYLIESEIARGGMGAVLRAVDCDIRREVAVKFMLDEENLGAKLRFIEEAQITGQLEHPNIVPIHELGIDATRRLFFSMKMVRGRSLAQVIEQLREDPKLAEKEYTPGRLLNIFINVCHALAYAHARDVVHRDLKPANVMLGDFGEVYVMDWGLAKVLKGAGQAVRLVGQPEALIAARNSAVPGTQAGKPATNRNHADADLTQEGAVLGTPVYMPPEQAHGRIQDIDPRSDVYSLGAILYELLTLQPPVEKEGGYTAVLCRVIAGEIAPPPLRAPERAKAGKVPPELAAIAMKALAKEPAQRYPTVEALRRDVERFQEGRTVSAKEYTSKEMLWKLVKRNKVVSVAATLLVAVVLWSSVTYTLAQRETAKAQQEFRDQVTKSVPAFIEAARLYVERKNLPKALDQLEVVLIAEPNQADALLLKGQILIVRADFVGASAELDKYLEQRPKDADARQLIELCRQADPKNIALLFAFADVFQRQHVPALAEQVGALTGNSLAARQKLLPIYQKKIETAWSGLGSKLRMDKDGLFHLHLANCVQVISLEPLRGMPLSSLELASCVRIQDLAPLKDMPLTVLNLYDCVQVRDLAPLKGMPLTTLNLFGCTRLRDLTPLQGMPLTTLDLTRLVQLEDLTPLQGIKLLSLKLGGCQKVRELTPLHGMPLTSLMLANCASVSDLTPLKGVPLTSLVLGNCTQVRDLTPLQAMPLTRLALGGCDVRDLSPLQGMPLTWLSLTGCPRVRDLTPLKGMKLTYLSFGSGPEVGDLTPLQGMPLTTLDLYGTQVRDLTPLQGMSLTEVSLLPKTITKGMDVLRQMKSIITFGLGPAGKFTPAEFWKKYDAGDFGK